MQKLAQARSRSVSTNPGLSETGDTGVEGERDLLVESSQSFQGEESLKGAEQQRCAELLQALSLEKEHSNALAKALDDEKKHVEDLSSKLEAERLHSQELYKSLRVEHRACQRGNQRKVALQEQIKALKAANLVAYDGLQHFTKCASQSVDNLLKVKKENAGLQQELASALNRAAEDTEGFGKKLKDAAEKLKASRLHVRRLQRQCQNAAIHKEKAVEKAKAQNRIHSLLHKGVYTEESRQLMRFLVQAGCAREHVGKVIQAVLASAGVTVKGNPSRRTVTRAGREGLLYSYIQLGHEMDDVASMTFSGDGTTHRGIQFYARHINYAVESKAPDGGKIKKHVTRFLGVHSALDGTSEQSIKAWKETLSRVAEIYNQSPLQKRTGHLLRVVDIFVKLAGMNTDHCSKEKKDAKLMEKEKTLAIYKTLGEDTILEESNEELLPHFTKARAKMIEAAGGNEKWEGLDAGEQADLEANMMEKLLMELGKNSFEKLSPEEKRILKLFIWAGCGCHKDLNSVKGGNKAMMDWWKDNGIPGPVPLANRDNKATLEEIEEDQSDSELTAAQERALGNTSCGGVKAAKLAGDILNNKDDKKGYHDDFRWWWSMHIHGDFTFPDTSNTRFQCYCEAATELILHLPNFIEFMEYIKAKKTDHEFSNMEQNLWKALHCNATLTELAVLALYAQAISHPYMQQVRSPKRLNMLDLGPLHKKVYRHMKKIIKKPELLIGPNATHETGALDGKKWNRPEIFTAIKNLMPELPYLEDLLVAFFKGAARTWKRFISEFAPGGLIDEATAEEREAAWMPPTNDANEGALGAYRVAMRRQPWLSEDQFNAWYMARVNGTEEFIKNVLTHPEDHKFVHKLAREGESQGKQMKKKALVEHNEAKIQKRKKATEKRKARAEKIKALKLICDKDEVLKLTGESLNLQIQAFKLAGAPNIQGNVSSLKAAQKRQALVEAIESMSSGKWMYSRESNGGDDADEDDADEGDADENDENEDEDEADEDEDSNWDDEDE